MDSGGNVFVMTAGGAVVPLATLSDPVRAINTNYERLTKRVRFFVSPRIATQLGNIRHEEKRKVLQSLIKAALEKAKHTSEVQ
jgi:hypothetical protein